MAFENTTSNATKRRPLTLLHYDGGGRKSPSEEDDKAKSKKAIPINGDHSSKVQEVLRCLKCIKMKDPTAKAVVFSSVSFISGACPSNFLNLLHYLSLVLVEFSASNNWTRPRTKWNCLYKPSETTGQWFDPISFTAITLLGSSNTT